MIPNLQSEILNPLTFSEKYRKVSGNIFVLLAGTEFNKNNPQLFHLLLTILQLKVFKLNRHLPGQLS